jgi:peptidoglycan hydrolase-like protein with peptidoglycan-binding domain/DNA invertase Pin-like site-specific DNA recombinase
MRSKTNAAPSRLVGALIGTVLLAALLAVPQASAAAVTKPQAASSAAGLLARGAGYGQPEGSAGVRALQLRLSSAGEVTGPIDGRFGPLTEAAVRRFQIREGLAVDGLVGPQTQKALRREAALLRPGAHDGGPQGSTRVRTLQRDLRSVGEHPGPIDGRFGPLTEHAVQHLQRQEGLAIDGIVGKATGVALARRLTQVRSTKSGQRPAQPTTRHTNASVPAGQPKGAPTPEEQSGGSGGSRTTAIAGLAVAAALVLLCGALVLRARRRRPTAPPRERRPPFAGEATRGQRPIEQEAPMATSQFRTNGAPMLGYATVGISRGHLDGDFRAQAERIVAECRRRGLSVVEFVREREPQRRSALERPALGYALQRISAGDAQGLAVADLSRLSRSVTELGRVLEWFSRSGARLVAVEQGIDTGERSGQLAARTLVEVSGWEHARLVARTREGMRAARRKGPPGVADYPELSERIASMRRDGMTLQAIADQLNAEGVPTVRGGAKWRPSSVQAAAGYRRPPTRVPLDATFGGNGDANSGGG